MALVQLGSSIGVNRLATWNEVRCAMSLLSQGDIEVDGVHHAYNLAEDMMWPAMLASIGN